MIAPPPLMSTKSKEILSVLVFDNGNFPVLSPAFQCMIHTTLEKADEYFRRVVVDVIFVGKSEAHPSVISNLSAISRLCPSSQLIALVRDLKEAEEAFANGAADCILREALTVETAEQRALFVTERARYLRHGGENQLYTHSDLAAIARVLSHDIRNALSGIVLSLEPIRQACGTNADAKSYVDILDRSASKLNQVINRFSSATGNIALRPKDENLVDLLRHAVATMPELAGGKVKVIEEFPEGEIILSLDREKFPLAVTNLISNAIDAIEGRANGHVRIKADVQSKEVVLTVEDNGHGIDFTTLQNVFRPFFTTRPGKAGLGLPMAQSIITAHGGSLRIESSNGAGTTVTCRLPLVK